MLDTTFGRRDAKLARVAVLHWFAFVAVS